jgi:DNA-directed RNA polymerase subunit RPC12/RpoP
VIRIQGDEESGYLTTVACDECDTRVVFRPRDHGLWIGSARQVRIYLTDHAGWVWDENSGAFYCPEHFR